MRPGLLLAALVAACLPGCAEDPPPPPPPPAKPQPSGPQPPKRDPSLPPALWGQVQDSKGNPVEGVEVYLARGSSLRPPDEAWPADLPRPVRSAADGSWMIEGAPRGVHRVVARAPGHRPFLYGNRGAWKVGPGLNNVGRATLVSGTALRGEVVDEAGRPLPGILVKVESPGIDSSGEARTGGDGKFEVRGLDANARTEHVVTVAAREFLWTPPKVVRAAKDSPLRIQLVRGRSIEGVLLDAAGRPVPHGLVLCWSLPDGADLRGTNAGEDGRFEIPGRPPTGNRILADAMGLAFPVFLADPGDRALELRAEAPATIRGRVLGPRGLPLEGAVVSLARRGDGEPPLPPRLAQAFADRRERRVLADATGSFRFEGILGGDVTVEAAAPLLDPAIHRGTARGEVEVLLRLGAGSE